MHDPVAQSLAPLPLYRRVPCAGAGRTLTAAEAGPRSNPRIWRPFACAFAGCQMRCRYRSEMERHLRIHTGERPFACPWEGCARAFAQRSSQQLHLRCHTGDKPFACSLQGCTRRFVHNQDLTRHLATHTRKQGVARGDKAGKKKPRRSFSPPSQPCLHSSRRAPGRSLSKPFAWRYDGTCRRFIADVPLTPVKTGLPHHHRLAHSDKDCEQAPRAGPLPGAALTAPSTRTAGARLTTGPAPDQPSVCQSALPPRAVHPLQQDRSRPADPFLAGSLYAAPPSPFAQQGTAVLPPDRASCDLPPGGQDADPAGWIPVTQEALFARLEGCLNESGEEFWQWLMAPPGRDAARRPGPATDPGQHP